MAHPDTLLSDAPSWDAAMHCGKGTQTWVRLAETTLQRDSTMLLSGALPYSFPTETIVVNYCFLNNTQGHSNNTRKFHVIIFITVTTPTVY